MKTIKITYWIVTILISALLVMSGIQHMMSTPDSIAFMNNLGYPAYILPPLGVAKILGVIAILIPGFPRLKEWAYAGLAYDLIGAAYSIIAKYGLKPDSAIIFIFVAMLFASYFLYHKKLKAERKTT